MLAQSCVTRGAASGFRRIRVSGSTCGIRGEAERREPDAGRRGVCAGEGVVADFARLHCRCDSGEFVRYRCHVGHTYRAELPSIALDENVRRAIGGALRALKEWRAVAKAQQEKAEKADQRRLAACWARRADEIEQELDVIRDREGGEPHAGVPMNCLH